MSLTDELLRLAELDRHVVRAVVEGDTDDLGEALGSYMALRQDLRKKLLDRAVATVEDAAAAKVLRKLTSTIGLPSDEIMNRLKRYSESDADDSEFDKEELWHLGSNYFYSWYSHEDYVKALAELRPLIHENDVPDSVSKLLHQVRDTYAFGLYQATYALCRTAIEVAIRDVCVRRSLFPDLGKETVLFEKYHWSRLRDKVSSGMFRERLKKHYHELSMVLHGRRTVEKEDAQNAFKNTLEIVEQLYRRHGL